MNRKKFNLPTVLFIFFSIILIITAIVFIILKLWKSFFLSILSFSCLSIPFIITYAAENKKILLPSHFTLVTLIFIFSAQYFGETIKFYYKFWWWDLILHLFAGYYGVVIALHILKGFITKNQKITQKRFNFFIIVSSFSFSVTLETLWEMFEFTSDSLFNTNLIKGGFIDTIEDLLIGISAAFLTATIYYLKNNNSKIYN